MMGFQKIKSTMRIFEEKDWGRLELFLFRCLAVCKGLMLSLLVLSPSGEVEKRPEALCTPLLVLSEAV